MYEKYLLIDKNKIIDLLSKIILYIIHLRYCFFKEISQILVTSLIVLSIKSLATFEILAWQSFTLLPLTRHSFACLETYISLNSNGFMRSYTLFDFSWVQETNLSTLFVFLSKHWSIDEVSFSLISGSNFPRSSPLYFMTASITSLILESIWETVKDFSLENYNCGF